MKIARKTLILLLLIFGLGYFLRVMFLPQKILTFGYDQARDAYVTQQILSGDLKILGPPASTEGLHHGVFYYYFLAPAYLMGDSPINAAYWTALFNAAVMFLVFGLTYLMTKSRFSSFLAAFLFAISFEATQYATWLSNPTIGIWTVPIMYIGLWIWITRGSGVVSKEKASRLGPMLSAIGLGLSIQSEIFLAYHMIPLLIWIWIAKKTIIKKEYFIFAAFFLASVLTMIAVEIKFGFKAINGLQNLAVQSEASLAYADSLGDYLVLYLNQIGRIFSFNSYPANIGYGGAFVLIIAGWALLRWKESKQKIHWGAFLATWLFSHITVVSVGGQSTPFLMVGIGPAVSITIAIFLGHLWQKKNKTAVVLIIALLVFGNLSMIVRENKDGSTLFAIQKDMLLSKQMDLIDYTYQQAEDDDFSINTLTSPLDINIVWTYLYESYGEKKYGYTPCFTGASQVGQLAALPECDTKESHFLIVEPMGGIPQRHLESKLTRENSKTEVVGEKVFGKELIVQKREKI